MEEVCAHVFMQGADNLKYGSLKKYLRSEFGREQNNGNVYPKTMEQSIKVLNTHSWDQAHCDNKKKQRSRDKDNRQREQTNNNPNGQDGGARVTSFEQRNGGPVICFKCGQPNHKTCLLYTSPSPRDLSTSRMPSSA